MKKLDTKFRANQIALGASLFVLMTGQMTGSAAAGPREDCAALYRQGVQYSDQHNYAKAADALERAAKLGETALGPNAPELSDVYYTLGHTDFSLGHYAEAAAALQHALAIREKAFPPTHPKVVNSINDLAFLDDTLGRYDEAEPLYKRAAAIQEKISGPKIQIPSGCIIIWPCSICMPRAMPRPSRC